VKKTIVFLGADAAYLYDFRSPLFDLFLERGWRVVAIATLRNGYDPKPFADKGVEFLEWRVQKAALNPAADLGPVLWLYRTLRRLKPDILFAHTVKAVIYGLLVARIAGVPRKVALIPGLGYAFVPSQAIKQRIVGLVGRLGYRAALSAAQICILQNADDLQTLKRVGVLSGRTPTAIVNGSGVDMERHRPEPWPEGPPTFLMLARLVRDKGVPEFVEAARRVRAQVPDARFLLAGGSDPNPGAVTPVELEQWRREGVVEVLGHVSDPRPLFKACHVFVLPSYYGEGCPRVNLEAMASGRAVITTDWVGCRETVVDGENGLLVPPRDADALAKAMLSLARDLPRAQAMGEAGRRLCQARFELGAVARRTADLIEGAT